jgi:PhnT2: putative 2-aminoethylphosphonate ABC transporter, ATP-binding protein
MGSPLEIYKSPKTPFVAQFVGRSSIVENYESLKGFENRTCTESDRQTRIP